VFLSLPYAATSVQLIFTFGTSTVPRNWRVKIAMLPCGADYLGIYPFNFNYRLLAKIEFIIIPISSKRMFAVFHDGHRFGADVQLEGRRHWHIDPSTCQSGLLHMFQDRIGQQTGDLK
jgi:hypothetical protein